LNETVSADESSVLPVLEIVDMVKTLERTIAEVERLPSDIQERIARDLLAHVEKLRSLSADLAKGIRSLEEGRGRELDIEDVIRRARSRNAKA
jgi:hypothetical protein